MRPFFTASLLALLLSACGLKGPLYLPQELPPPPQSPQSPQAPQPQQSQDEEKKK